LLWILNTVPGERNLYKFVLTLVVFHASWVTFTPLLFVLIKWVVIGRYRKGRYPIWGEYYLRWWFVDVLRKLIGRGSWGAHHVTLNLYYRMLGAKIGKNARISETADVAEFDLVSIGEGASVEHATVRGFGVDNGCIILGPVEVGDHASVGIRSVVAPYTSIPDNTHLGPSTASYEINAMTEPGRNVEHLHYNRQALPECSRLAQTFMVGPCLFLCDSLSHIPALLVLFWMLEMRWNVAEPFNTTGDLMEWLCDPRRIPFFIGIRIARAILSPVFYMFGAILIKWIVIGKFEPGPRDTTSDWQLCRHELAACLFTRERMQQLTDLIGRHYEGISVLYRLLGAKVGKRVFWPGRQPVFTGEFDLLDIGDDVVFGSRASLICTTTDSAEKITLCAGSNVSDNTVVLPGSVIGKGAVLGSNAVCAEGQYLPEASVWLGARGGQPVLLEKGVEEDIDRPILASEVHPSKLQMEGDDSTLRPFGRAFYNREAPYFVFPLSLIFLYTIVVRVLLAAFSSLPVIAAMHLAAGYFYGWPMYERSYALVQVSSSSLYTTLVFFFMVTHFLHTMAWLTVEIASKWGFMGQRQEGRHNWDRSNYSQNWEFYQLLSPVRDLGRMNFLDFICGTPFMSTFFRLLGCKVGNDCCLYPAGGDPYMPEPDLVEMGNRCVIDCASVVCHLNTRGNFELKKITMQNNVTLRCRGRIQQGVHMESGSMLLEKSLAMTGEVIESDSVWLGAPAARLLSYDTSSIDTRPSTRSNFPDSPPRGGAFV
jgi:carbonic anhydrase/acetyltransferase-like protein (isoleucine patch superfamily)